MPGSPPGHQVQIYDTSWGGWRWYDGLTPKPAYSRRVALQLAEEAAHYSFSLWFRVVNLNRGQAIRVYSPRGYATGQAKPPQNRIA